jgi:hypothetical protein
MVTESSRIKSHPEGPMPSDPEGISEGPPQEPANPHFFAGPLWIPLEKVKGELKLATTSRQREGVLKSLESSIPKRK